MSDQYIRCEVVWESVPFVLVYDAYGDPMEVLYDNGEEDVEVGPKLSDILWDHFGNEPYAERMQCQAEAEHDARREVGSLKDYLYEAFRP